jgi:hypothetical protein
MQHAALALPAANRQRGRAQGRPGLLGDYLECVTETVGAQHGLRHLQHRTQCPHIIDDRGVKEMGVRGVLAAGDGLLSVHWQLLVASAVVWLILLKTHENSTASRHSPGRWSNSTDRAVTSRKNRMFGHARRRQTPGMAKDLGSHGTQRLSKR